MTPEDQVVTLYAGVRGFLDKTPVAHIEKFEQDFLKHVKSSKSSLLDAIRTEGQLSESSDAALKETLKSFMATWTPAM